MASRAVIESDENLGDAPAPSGAKGRSSGYASPSILARRHRILTETRKMIAEVGLARLAMDDVARRANVAKRTLYNAFQSKEHLVATAISKYFEAYERKIHYTNDDATTLDWMVERLIIVARRNLAIRNYTRALMDIYHSSDVDPEIRQAIHDIAARSHAPWIRKLASSRQLQPWINPDLLISLLVRYRYALAQAWTEGEIKEDDLVLEVLRGFFTFMAGATRSRARKEILELLDNLEDHPLLRQATLPAE